MPIGFHVSKGGRRMNVALREDLDYLRGQGIKYPCVQIFVTGPQNFKETLNADEKAGVRAILMQEKIPLVIHGSYVDNPWSKNPAGVQNIITEMKIGADLGATGVVVHLAAAANDDDNLAYVLEKIAELDHNVKRQCIFWLEINTAKASANTFETPDKLADLFRRVRLITGNPAENPDALRVGLCIDSAHLFACGFAMDSYDITHKWLTDVQASLPAGTPIMMHLNDSGSTLGSGRDRHAALCQGNIWRSFDITTGRLKIEDSGLMAILNWAEAGEIVLILERDNEGIKSDINLIRTLGYFI